MTQPPDLPPSTGFSLASPSTVPWYPPAQVPPPAAGEPSLWVRLRRRWGLLLVTGFATVYLVVSLVTPWFTNTLIAAPVRSDSQELGLGHFGIWTYGYAAGVIVLLLLVLAAVVLPQRIGGVLALAGLALTVPLALDLVVLAFKLGQARTVSGEAGAALLAASGDQIKHVWFLVNMPAAHHAGFAVLLLGVVAMQIPRPELAPHLLAGVGIAAGLLSLALPWATAYLAVDGKLQVQRYWLWSVNSTGVLLAVGMLLLAGMATVGLATGRMPLPLMIGLVVLGNLVLWQPSLLEAAEVVGQQLKAQDPMSVEPNGAVRFMEFGALFLVIAAIRLWWRGRRRARQQAAETPQVMAGSPTWPTAP